RQLFVAEPGGDGDERGGVPGLTIGKTLVEFTEQVGGLVGHAIDAFDAFLGETARFTEDEGAREIRSDPERFEIGREEEVRRAKDVVAVGKLEVELVIDGVELESARLGGIILGEGRKKR